MTTRPRLILLAFVLAACAPSPEPRAPDHHRSGDKPSRGRQIVPSRGALDQLRSKVRAVVRARRLSCNDVRERMATLYANRYWSSHYRVIPGPCPPTAAGRGGGGGGARGRRYGAPRLHFTGTNNQTRGIEESDAAVTDGAHLYLVTARGVTILRVGAPNRRVVAKVPMARGWTARRLLLSGHRLVVFSERFTRTRVTVLDVRKPNRPRYLRQLELDGRSLLERGLGDDVLLVLEIAQRRPFALLTRIRKRQHQPFGTVNMPCCGGGSFTAQKARVKAWARRALASVPMKALLPRVRRSVGTAPTTEAPLLRCRDIRQPATANAVATLVTVIRLRLTTGALRATGLLAQARTVYVTPRSVYLTRVRTQSIRRRYCGGAAPPPMPFAAFFRQHTVLHRFALKAGEHVPVYRATTEVEGTVLNSFALDEHRGHLRVATTAVKQRPLGQFVSHLYVLRARGQTLTLVGGVRDLAPGERIYAVRYLGDRGYVVTFPTTRRIIRMDPFFSLNLADPKHPRVTGKLKIPGFSNYLHPFGQGRLLAVGQDADQRGRPKGVHLQIFDVRNPKRPRRIAHLRISRGQGSAVSAAQVDHHAFLYDPVTGILALPLRNHVAKWAGAVVLQAHPTRGLSRIGQVDHADLVPRRYCPKDPRRCAVYAPISRVLISGPTVVTVSRWGVKVSARAKGLVTLKTLRLVTATK